MVFCMQLQEKCDKTKYVNKIQHAHLEITLVQNMLKSHKVHITGTPSEFALHKFTTDFDIEIYDNYAY